MESKSGTEKVTPSQRARDAAADYGLSEVISITEAYEKNIRAGLFDDGPRVQAFARFERQVAQEAEQKAMELGDLIDEVFGLLTPPGNIWTGNEPEWQNKAWMMIRDVWDHLPLSPAPESTEKAGC